jgi:phosphate transport system permease protein
MPLLWLISILLVLACIGFVVARRRALASAEGRIRELHSLPSYYGLNAAILTIVPALAVILAWLLIQPVYSEYRVVRALPAELQADEGTRSLALADIARIAFGLDALVEQNTLDAEAVAALSVAIDDVRALLGGAGVAIGSEIEPHILAAAQRYRAIRSTGGTAASILALALAAGGLLYGTIVAQKDYRARNVVERAFLGLLILAASIAILTTVGIVLSMLFETINFFEDYPWHEFLFGLNWSPNFRGNSDLGILPLLWGTLYISFVALCVAVPIGLFAAIYLGEYAGRRTRAIAKPLLEILAGIPTIVYGLFALVTVGPLLRDYFAEPMGLGNSASSVMTAGLVMGIMLIPFVSSLSDDVITAVPQAMRDGSLGVGATHSETIRRVILPAALPGIVGAVLLAASRAIGETMIVVLGAGAAARLDLNPFEAMTTVTVKIVSQLTGDTDFASPETLVAFALGFTLFVITLGLNVLALYIVRRYREQYE